jgi:hypothetical protein
MSPNFAPSVGFSTAAEAAWFEQEISSEAAADEYTSSTRRVLLVFAAAFLMMAGVLGVARATVSPPRAADGGTAPAAETMKLASASAPAAKTAPSKPNAQLNAKAKAKAPVAKKPARPVHKGHTTRRGAQHRRGRHG